MYRDRIHDQQMLQKYFSLSTMSQDSAIDRSYAFGANLPFAQSIQPLHYRAICEV